MTVDYPRPRAGGRRRRRLPGDERDAHLRRRPDPKRRERPGRRRLSTRTRRPTPSTSPTCSKARRSPTARASARSSTTMRCPRSPIDDVAVIEDAPRDVREPSPSRSRRERRQVTVDYATADGTAQWPRRLQARTGTLTFAPGQTSKMVTVPVNGDVLDETTRPSSSTSRNPTNATIIDGQGVGTIVDDDGLPSLSINDVTVTEGQSRTTNAVFTVTLRGGGEQTVTVDFATADGTAPHPSTTPPRREPSRSPRGHGADDHVPVVQRPPRRDRRGVHGQPLEPDERDDRRRNRRGHDHRRRPAVALDQRRHGHRGRHRARQRDLTVALSAPSELNVTVDFATADGTATAPADYGDEWHAHLHARPRPQAGRRSWSRATCSTRRTRPTSSTSRTRRTRRSRTGGAWARSPTTIRCRRSRSTTSRSPRATPAPGERYLHGSLSAFSQNVGSTTRPRTAPPIPADYVATSGRSSSSPRPELEAAHCPGQRRRARRGGRDVLPGPLEPGQRDDPGRRGRRHDQRRRRAPSLSDRRHFSDRGQRRIRAGPPSPVTSVPTKARPGHRRLRDCRNPRHRKATGAQRVGRLCGRGDVEDGERPVEGGVIDENHETSLPPAASDAHPPPILDPRDRDDHPRSRTRSSRSMTSR